ncbi:hypothetical protein MWU38_07370 [Qipengyuania sp. S6317L1]|uniref:hypothetical protein n=1 Tax=Qipengyuania sp. S6317L1 TaxID=2926410 RepID=UPI001FF447B4|nr:hypothetical protein [Qipengyuania sp. S6317L1]MCK0099197.1 hypothetical protein [Qipengyuania sp. S6317L1]
MIDYFALALGHGLLVLAFVRLVTRDSLDTDPAISDLEQAAKTSHPNKAERRNSRKPSEPHRDSAQDGKARR